LTKKINMHSEILYEQLFNLCEDAMLLVRENTIVLCNTEAVSLLKYRSQKALLSEKIDTIIPHFHTYHKESSLSLLYKQESQSPLSLQISLKTLYVDEKLHYFLTLKETKNYKNINYLHSLTEPHTSSYNVEKAQALAKIGFWSVTLQNSLLAWSKETYKIFDIDYETNQVKTIDDFYSAIHPDDIAKVTTAYNRHLETQEPYIIEHRIITRKNNLKYVEERCETEFDKDGNALTSTGTIQDITQRKILEIELQEKMNQLNQSKELLETIFNSNMYAIAIMDETSHYLLVNDTYETLTGYRKEELYATSCFELTHPKMRASSKRIFEQLLENGYSHGYEKQCLKKDGQYIDVIMDAIKLQNSKNILVIVKDITPQKKFEIEKKLHEHKMIQQSRLAQMGEMISMIAHQWRQPLGAISTTVINLKLKLELEAFDFTTQNGLKEANNYLLQRLENIEDFVQNLTTTIDDFRNFYKPNKESLDITFQELTDKALKLMQHLLEKNNIVIKTLYNSQEKITMYENEMLQVLLNILKNSQDNFLERGIFQPKITIQTIGKKILISDNGGGINPQIIDKIFDPYFSTKTQKNGTGLGLYMSKTIVHEHHHGTIDVKNSKSGVVFTIDLTKERKEV